MSNLYFNNLNYTFGNEDSSLETFLLKDYSDSVFAVAGSGTRVIPLFSKHPKKVTCVDSSLSQLRLSEFRIECMKALSYQEFMAFWGYGKHSMSAHDRKEVFLKIKLRDDTRKYILSLFEEVLWESLLYQGNWERSFRLLSRINRIIIGKRAHQLFDADSITEHLEFMRNKWPKRRWDFSLFLLGNSKVFNALLYKGVMPKNNTGKSLYRYYHEAFQKVLMQGVARNNFFLQLLFLGEVKLEEGFPIECDRRVYEESKKGMTQAEIEYIHGDVLGVLKDSSSTYDFVSFSDVPSYFNDEDDSDYLQKISSKISSGGTVVVRNYLHKSKSIDLCGYELMNHKFEKLLYAEKVQMYEIDIYRRI